MSWIDKMVGGTVTYEGQGPLWATLGANLGVGPAGTQDEPLAPLSGSSAFRLAMVRWRAGATVTGVLAGESTAEGALITLQQRGKVLGSAPPFANHEGHFWMTVPVHEGAFAFHLPFGALKYDDDDGAANLQVALTGGGKMVASELFNLTLPPARPWDAVDLFEPLIRLCVGVAHADGRFLEDEGRRVHAYFERELGLDAHGKAQLRRAIDAGPPNELQDAADELCVRFPGFRPSEVLEFLAGVAFADGEVAALEVKFLEDVARVLGVPEQRWPTLRDDLGLDDP